MRLTSTLSARQLCLLLTFAMGIHPAPSRSEQQPSKALSSQIDAYIATLVSSNNFAGVVLVAKGDEVLFQKGYGEADVEHHVPNSPQTRFHVASVSKPFTAAAILLLAERGQIDLNAPLIAVLPGYPGASRLSIHHLLAHTSGIPNINAFADYDEIQYRRHSTAELVDRFKNEPLKFEPGAKYDYSNSNYNLLAHIIERVSGAPYGDFLQRELFRPLGMDGTAHPRDMATLVPGLATGYVPAGTSDLERARYIDWSVKIGNGSLYSSAPDLHRWVRAIHGGRVLKPPSLELTFRQHTPNVGYGWFVVEKGGRTRHHINGRLPGCAAQVTYYVEDQLTVMVLSNISSSVTSPAAIAIGAMYFGEEYSPMPTFRRAPLSAEEAARVVGSYQFGADYYVPNSKVIIVNRGGFLHAEYPSGYPASPLLTVSGFSYIARPFWSTYEFVPGADGRAVELIIDTARGARTDAP